jgi:G3E family GTPase
LVASRARERSEDPRVGGVGKGTRVAVVSNEFGELGIDQALLGDGGEAFVELEGGCVCCKLSDELLETLQMLWERVRPERVIVETSGVALPSEVQLSFWREPVSRWVSVGCPMTWRLSL